MEVALWEKQEGTSPRGYAKPYQDKGLRLRSWHAKAACTVPNLKQNMMVTKPQSATSQMVARKV